jgi:hypothetical protein
MLHTYRKSISYKKEEWRLPSKKKKRGKNLSPRNKKACHNVSTTLLKSVAEIGTHSAMKSSRETLHEFTSHKPQKTPKRNISRSTNEKLHTDRKSISCKKKEWRPPRKKKKEGKTLARGTRRLIQIGTCISVEVPIFIFANTCYCRAYK